MNQVDLHCHTTASDGVLKPRELVRRAAHLALIVMAVTDHDTTAGLPEALAAGRTLGIEVIPGLEINTDVPGGEVHVLGYFIDWQDPAFTEQLARLREGRLARACQMVDKLAALGAPIRLERVLQLARDGSVGRPHVAQALLEAGYVATFGEAFDRYIGRSRPAYVERLKFSPADACRLIRKAGGVPVWAHPIPFDAVTTAPRGLLPFEGLLPELLDAGLQGLEVYYPGYGARAIEYLTRLAHQHELILTGGTDFHGFPPIPVDVGGIYVPMKAVRRLRATWEKLRA